MRLSALPIYVYGTEVLLRAAAPLISDDEECQASEGSSAGDSADSCSCDAAF